MIYLKKTTEVQTIYIPRQEVLGTAYTSLVKGYEDGYKDGLKAGAEDQKSQLINLYVTENGEYERENGYGKITVDVPQEGGGGDCPSYKNITDVYATADGEVITFAAKVAVKWTISEDAIWMIVSDNSETILARGSEDLAELNEGDECLFTGLVSHAQSGYKSLQDVRVDELLTSGNNIAMPIEAKEVTDENFLTEIYTPNEDGNIKAKYVYLDGVITRMMASTNRFQFRVGSIVFTLRTGKPEWLEQYAVGDEVRVYGFTDMSRAIIFPATVIKKGEPCVINNEEKSIYIDVNGHYDVYPNDTYDGLSKVGIDVNINCNSAYEEGYNVGYQAAIGELTEISVTENGRYEGKFSAVNVDVPTGGGSCNLEDKWVTPSMNDRDGNGLIVVTPSEGYDGLSRTVIDPQTIYNEGVEVGKAEGGGGEGGSCNLEAVDINASPYDWAATINPSEGYDGLSSVIVRYEEAYALQREWGKNDALNNLGNLYITENGTYNINDTKTTQMLNFGQDGNIWYTTDYTLSSSSRVEIRFIMVNDNHEEQILIESGNLSFRLGGGGISAVVNGIYLWNISYDTNTNTVNTLIFDARGYTVNGQIRYWRENDAEVNLWEQIEFGSPIIIGKGFKNGLVAVYVDGTALLPSQDLTFGGFANEGTGTPTFEEKELRIFGGYGWKEVNVNVTDFDSDDVEGYFKRPMLMLYKNTNENAILDKSKFGINAEDIIAYDFPPRTTALIHSWKNNHLTLEKGAIDWSKVEKMYIYTIDTFGENMCDVDSPNISELVICKTGTIDTKDIMFEDGCFKNCSRLNKIVFDMNTRLVMTSGNPFEGVSETGQVIVNGPNDGTNIYPDFMNTLPSGWTLTFDADYIIE